MGQKKILLDSNAYFRLAQHIHPLLKTPVGKDNHCLYVIADIQREYDNNPRLRKRFRWVNVPEYRENRSDQLNISTTQRHEIERAYGVMEGTAIDRRLAVSPVDIKCLAKGDVLEIPVVTDDNNMHTLAGLFFVRALRSLELLKLMRECRYIDMKKVRDVVTYWMFYDPPRKREGFFRKEYKALFNEEPPE
ncbi:MAG: hypothetical protein JRE40_11115 [Deltaproteobacteria bacterium]|nr:hypothetical protein [Deltaproteobacteria bacterium]